MKFASSATLLLAAALSTLSAAQTTFITQASAKPMIVKPGGLVTVSLEVVFTEDFRRRLEIDEDPFYIGCYAPELGSEMSSLTFNKNGTKDMDKRNKTDNAKPDKAARPGGKLDMLFEDGDIILRSASIKPNNFRPKIVADTQFFEEVDGLVFFEVPRDEITQLKTYTAIFKYRLGDDWESGDIATFLVGTRDGEEVTEPVSVIVR